MTIDLIAIGILGLFGVLGWFSGALSQVLRVVAVVVAFVAAAPVARLLKSSLFPDNSVSGPLLEGLFLIASGLLVYLTIAVFAWLFVRTLWASSDGVSTADRTGGLLLGLLKATVIVYFLVSAVSMMQGPLREFDDADRLGFEESRLLTFVERYHLLVVWRFGDLERLHRALELSRLEARFEGDSPMAADSDAAKLLRTARMRRLTRRENLVEAAVHDRYYETLADSLVRECLNDDRFVARLRLVEWKKLIETFRNRRKREAAVESSSTRAERGSRGRYVIRRRSARISGLAPLLRGSRSTNRRSIRVRPPPAAP